MNDLFAGGEDRNPEPDPSKNYLEELVGEGKKFRSNEDLARGKWEADATVDILKKKLDQMREDYQRVDNEYKASASLREHIDQLMSRPHASNENTPVNDEQQKPAFDPNQVKELISESIHQHELTKKQEENFGSVEKKLRETYGPNYKDHLKTAVEDLGLEASFVNDLARNQPRVLLRTLGIEGQGNRENFQAPPQSLTHGFAPKGKEKRTWAWYQKMKKDNPTLYNSKQTNAQMIKDALELGDEFEDGNF